MELIILGIVVIGALATVDISDKKSKGKEEVKD